jgi:16S rRNA (guanine966-N2)-methyltransferase
MSDRAREGLFSSLGRDVLDVVVLDLYAGTGALGIEALSRGARHATFVERSRGALAVISDNLDRTHLTGSARVVPGDVVRHLRGSPPLGEEPGLVFLDPPYDLPADEVRQALAHLDARWLPPDDTWKVYLTRPRRSSTVVVPIGWGVARRLRYGDNLVICYHREG